MKKRLVSLAICLCMVCMSLVGLSSAGAGATLTMPDNDGHTDGVSYTLGEGTTAECQVICNFIPRTMRGVPTSQRPGDVQVQKYIVIHNTGNYRDGADAKAHNDWLTTANDTAQSYQYVVGSDAIYQNLPDTERALHTGTNRKLTGIMNSNAIGIETCVNLFPATENYGGEQWNTEEMYAWYENEFALRTDRVALLAATLCIRYGMNPYTQVVQHNDVYDKNCPMQMRYVFGTDGVAAGSFDRENGTYWKIFWNKMIEYYKAYGGTYKEGDTDVIGTDGNKYPDRYVEENQIDSSATSNVRETTTELNLRTAPSTGNVVGSLPAGTQFTIKSTNAAGTWGLIDYKGEEVWISLNSSYSVPVIEGIANKDTYALEAPVELVSNDVWKTTVYTKDNSLTVNGFVLSTAGPVGAVQYMVEGEDHWTACQTVNRPELKESNPGYPSYRDNGFTVTFDISDWGNSTVVYFRYLTFTMGKTEVGTLKVVKGDKPDAILGDANADGGVDSIDASAILKYDAGIVAEIDSEVADVNGDGYVDALDAAKILQFDAGIIDEL